jgi:hypothetical protein
MKKMCILIVILLTIINIEKTIFGQQLRPQEKDNNHVHMYVPKEVVLPIVVPQKESPLKIEEISIYIKNNKIEYLLSVKNKGRKAIKGFAYGVIGKESGSLYSFTAKPLINPNQKVSNTLAKNSKITPLTPEIKEIFKIYDNGRLQEILLFIITEIEFEDGSTFSDLKTFDLIEKFRQEN